MSKIYRAKVAEQSARGKSGESRYLPVFEKMESLSDGDVLIVVPGTEQTADKCASSLSVTLCNHPAVPKPPRNRRWSVGTKLDARVKDGQVGIRLSKEREGRGRRSG